MIMAIIQLIIQILQFHMSIEQKQGYLREVILQRGINPNEFFQYWNELNLELEDVQISRLKEIVENFLRQNGKHQHGKNQDAQEQFTDFQQAQQSRETKPSNDYAGFNWDFLTKNHHSQKLNESSPIQKQSNHLKQRKKQTPKKIKDKETKHQNQTLIQQASEQPSIKSNRLIDTEVNPKQEKTLTVKQVLDSSKLSQIKCLKLQQNVLSHHSNVQISITSVQELQDKSNNLITKIFGSSYLQFTIKTIARNKNRSIGISWEVKRKPQDFIWLRQTLIKFYPGLVVPPLPSQPKSKEKVYGYQKKLQNFLSDCYRCPELKNSKYYEVFLSYSTISDFQTFMKNTESNTKPKTLSHILNMSGVVETLYSNNIESYGLGLQNYLNKTSKHLKQTKSILNEINQHYQNISIAYKKLGNVFLEMSDQSCSFSNENCYQRLSKTYKQIAYLSNEHSNFIQSEKQLIDAFMQSHFAYQKDRLDNMQGLITKRSAFAIQLSKRTKQDDKKGMFGKIASFFGEKIDYVDTPSSTYDTLYSQVGYYNNQLLRESVRCIDVMIASHIDHFSGYGHTRIDNVDKMQKTWSNILVQLSKLNVLK